MVEEGAEVNCLQQGEQRRQGLVVLHKRTPSYVRCKPILSLDSAYAE
jgi:hypothetical protein